MNIFDQWAYYYYDVKCDIFADRHINLQHNKSEIVFEQTLKNDKSLNSRTAIETMIMYLFKKKGGKPNSTHAHYFTIGEFEQFYSLYSKPGCAKFPVSCFDSDSISFTFGESFDVFYRSRHHTKRKVYTVYEINNIYAQYYSDVCKKKNFFIEMQLWDNPEKYADKLKHINTPDIFKSQYKFNDVFSLQQRDEFKLYQTLIDARHYLNPSGYHGINHAICVLLYCVLLAKLNGLSMIQKKILYYAAIYHDIGRSDDGSDITHGCSSWIKLQKTSLLEKLTENEKAILRFLIINHCIDDNEMPDINVSGRYEHMLLYNLLKDADALFRIKIFNLDYNYLRNSHSHKLINIARTFTVDDI